MYAVNCIAFNKQYGTFATVGADGVYNFWDKTNKQRLKQFKALPVRETRKRPSLISARIAHSEPCRAGADYCRGVLARLDDLCLRFDI